MERSDTGAGRVPAAGVHDRYLSDAALRDAAAALRGLADTLRQVHGTFAGDAEIEAVRLTGLADDLTAWCRGTPGADGAPVRQADHAGEQQWAGLLRVYFRHALAAPPTGAAAPRRRRETTRRDSFATAP